ncbi:PE family protein [Rhodococcus triatomae]|uniref:PE family protein n=1 Tax=Rhodococcus triatomae TaxID=300028 RepID=A0A1G8HWB8_9NOCA|nr:PE family protein [Rhodococcus triatomae]QNG20896.1 PE family protein [Rhodococcus triatomae]QNG23189.1 PE family protein [Rhodococcus triatomae]SDI10897.1 PE family protein [Rhodococcus triatomae]
MALLQVSPEALIAAAVELDTLAARLETAVAGASPALRPLPSGSEEVSLHATGYFHTVANSFTPAIAQGIAELRATAATLKQQAANYVAQDLTHGGSISSIM